MRHRWACFFAFGFAVAGRTVVADDKPVPPEQSIRQWTQKLTSTDADERDRAQFVLERFASWDMPDVTTVARESKDLPPDARARMDAAIKASRVRYKYHLDTQKRHVERCTWLKTVLVPAYDAGGHTDPKWDAAARRGLTQDCDDGITTDSAEQSALADKARKSLDEAIAAGCDDPHVLAVAGLLHNDDGDTDKNIAALFTRARKAAGSGQTLSYTKIIIDGRVLRHKFVEAGVEPGSLIITDRPMLTIWKDMLDQYEALSKMPDVPIETLIGVAENVVDTSRAMHVDLDKAVFDRIYAPLEQADPENVRVLSFKSAFYAKYTWWAPGGGWARDLARQGGNEFAERLNVLEDTCEHAWQVDPTDPAGPTYMLTVELAREDELPVVMKWFDRAMEANPDNLDACRVMLEYLEPKWHGNPEMMIAFGRKCYDTGNWVGEVPFVLVDAHWALANLSKGKERDAYFKLPGVWDDIQKTYTGYLRRQPDATGYRSRFAYFACQCDHFDVAAEQFKTLGKDLVEANFDTPAQLKEFQKKAAKAGK